MKIYSTWSHVVLYSLPMSEAQPEDVAILHVRIEQRLLDDLKEQAEASDRTLSQQVRRILRLHMLRGEPEGGREV